MNVERNHSRCVDIAHHGDAQALQETFYGADGIGVKQGPARMLMHTVARIVNGYP